jgi:hypothetical protein
LFTLKAIFSYLKYLGERPKNSWFGFYSAIRKLKTLQFNLTFYQTLNCNNVIQF